MEARTIRRVRPADRTIPDGPATPGVHREVAFAGGDRWVGYATTVPGEMSGWHHHGDHDTFLYVVRGAIALQHGPDGSEHTLVAAGDFALVPKGAVHREGTPAGDPAEIVVVRIGSGPPVVPAQGPERAT